MDLMDIKFKKTYNNFVLNCNFDANEKINGIFGPSGSGKSTLLNCIAGFTNPDSGNISFEGEVFYDSKKKILLPPEKRNIGYVTQKSNLFPSMNISENIHYGYKEGNKINIRDIIEMMNISDLLSKFPNQISGGQAQKITIARALARNPNVLLMDEPLSELDLNSKLMILNYLKKINLEYNIPIIYVSHDVSEMAAICDNVFIINNGSIAKKISSSELSLESHGDSDFQNIYLTKANSSKILEINNVPIKVEMIAESGNVAIMIPSSSVIISNKKPDASIADNIIVGSLNNYIDLKSKIRLVCNVGFEIIGDISKKSFDNSNLKLNDQIYVIFKSISVKTSTK
jgi:molybdate transport system ATP-binding protein